MCVCVLTEVTVLWALLSHTQRERSAGCGSSCNDRFVFKLVFTDSAQAIHTQIRTRVMHADTQACKASQPHGPCHSGVVEKLQVDV